MDQKLPCLAELLILCGLPDEVKTSCKVFNQLPGCGEFQPTAHAAINGHVAYFPQKNPKFVMNNAVQGESCLQVESAGTSNLAEKQIEALLPLDTIESFTHFCLTGKTAVRLQKPADQVHYLILTNLKGHRSYASCLTYFLQYKVTQTDSGCILKFVKRDHGSSKCSVFISHCIAVISSQPYFSLLKDILSRFLPCVYRNDEQTEKSMLGLMKVLCSLPTPPASNCVYKFELLHTNFLMIPPASCGSSVVDIPLSVLMTCLEPPKLVQLIILVLLQGRIILVSKHTSLLTIFTQALLCAIHPLCWSLPLIPLLPDHLLDLLEAPGNYLMGCLTRNKPFLSQIENITVVDLDEGTIWCPGRSPTAPAEACTQLLLELHQLADNPFVANFSSPTQFSYSESQTFHLQQKFDNNQLICKVFLSFFVSILRDVIEFLWVEKATFNKSQFLQSRSANDRDFYQLFLETNMFRQFLKDRFACREDAWTRLELATRRKTLNALTDNILGDFQHGGRMARVLNPTAESVLEIVPVISLSSDGGRLEELLAEIAEAQVSQQAVNIRGSVGLLFLQGAILHRLDRSCEAIKIFYRIFLMNKDQLPRMYVSRVLRACRQEVHPYLSPEFVKQYTLLDSGQSSLNESIKVDFNEKLLNCLDYERFGEAMDMFGMAHMASTHRALFSLLAGANQEIDKSIFASFCEHWRSVCLELSRSQLVAQSLAVAECLLMMSDLIKTSQGSGRLLLTNSRLVFSADGHGKCTEICKLREIKSLEVVEESSFILKVQVLKIVIDNVGQSTRLFTANLKQSSIMWRQILNEMVAGKSLSELHRNPNLLKQAGQHCLLLQSLYRCQRSITYAPFKPLERKAVELCMLTLQRQTGRDMISNASRGHLLCTIDPSMKTKQRSSVEALLYTSGNISGDFDHLPKLWCGLSSGAIQVYNAASWTLMQAVMNASNRISSMVVIGTQIWVSSFDCKIYVICQVELKCVKILRGHSDMIVDLCHHSDLVYSLGCDGELLTWKTASVDYTEFVTIPNVINAHSLKHFNGQLFCSTDLKLLILSELGSLQRSHKLPGLVDFQISSDSKIWLLLGSSRSIEVRSLPDFQLESTISYFSENDLKPSRLLLSHELAIVASRNGQLVVFNRNSFELELEIEAHLDVIRTLASADQRYVFTGSASKDGLIRIWSLVPLAQPADLDSPSEVDNSRDM